MDEARPFLCARCKRQVLICSRCDRGQQYCGARCSGLARGESLRAAGRRYQQSRCGRHCHAERQRRWRTAYHLGRQELRGERAMNHVARLLHPGRRRGLADTLPLAVGRHHCPLALCGACGAHRRPHESIRSCMALSSRDVPTSGITMVCCRRDARLRAFGNRYGGGRLARPSVVGTGATAATQGRVYTVN